MAGKRKKMIKLIHHCTSCEECRDEDIADHLIANGVMVQEWIPVTERLPEHDGRYLCNVKYFSFPGSFYQAILEYDKHGFQEGISTPMMLPIGCPCQSRRKENSPQNTIMQKGGWYG